MSAYHAPTLDHLCKSIDDLANEYNYSGDERKPQIDLLKKLRAAHANGQLGDNKTAHEILLGAWMFIHHLIKNEYHYYSYIRSPKHSQLFCLAEAALGIAEPDGESKKEKNSLTKEATFCNFIPFLNYMQKNKDDFSPDLQNKAFLFAKGLRTELDPKLKVLCARLSEVVPLRKKFQEIPDRYKTKCEQDWRISKWLGYLGIGGRNKKRLEAVKFMQVLNERCNQIPTALGDEKPDDYFMRFGAMILNMRKIEKEYAYSFRSPENSDLYVELQRASGIRRSSDVSYDFADTDLSTLEELIRKDMNSTEKKEFWKNKAINLTELNRIKSEILKLRTSLEESKDTVVLSENETLNSLINSFISCISATIAQSGVMYALYEGVSFLMASGIGIDTLFTVASPQNAVILMGIFWAMKQVRTNISGTIAGVFVPYIDPFVKAPFMALNKQSLFGANSETALSSEDRTLVNAFYNAPLEVFSNEEKQELDRLFVLGKPASEVTLEDDLSEDEEEDFEQARGLRA